MDSGTRSGDDAIVVEQFPAAGVFRAELDGERAELAYIEAPGRITFIHTEVPPAFQGKGIAGRLAKAGLEYARARGLRVVPKCPFVKAYIEKHTEFQSLVIDV
jgi:predicted GNAT family acetyltransferase